MRLSIEKGSRKDYQEGYYEHVSQHAYRDEITITSTFFSFCRKKTKIIQDEDK